MSAIAVHLFVEKTQSWKRRISLFIQGHNSLGIPRAYVTSKYTTYDMTNPIYMQMEHLVIVKNNPLREVFR